MKVLRQYIDHLQGRYAAEGGIYWTLYFLSHENKEKYQSLSQNWSSNPKIFKEIKIGNSCFSISYEDPSNTGNTLKYGISDEESKININLASKEILLNLPSSSEELADAIIDWRDKNNHSERLGAETEYYTNLEIPYPSKNDNFERIEEILLVKGMSLEILSSWLPYITTYGEGKVNINTASREVLIFLGLDNELVDKILNYRMGSDGTQGTSDDGVFKDNGSIVRTLFEYEILNTNEISKLTNLVAKGFLGVQSKYFRVISSGMSSPNTFFKHKIRAVLEFNQNDETKIKSWNEY